ncbi:hypothetical protein ACFQL7_11820 [Halocatena marina]|uniref:Uncharacterized protein n=1 Tax=Halocatena marina TaxID=2934937 RepID=A0ABD5YQS0_9EURY
MSGSSCTAVCACLTVEHRQRVLKQSTRLATSVLHITNIYDHSNEWGMAIDD